MSAKRNSLRRGLGTLEEEIARYGRSGSDLEVDATASVDFEVDADAKSKMISIRIPGDLLDAVRIAAKAACVPYQTLIKEWLRASLARAETASQPVARPFASPIDLRGQGIARERTIKELAGAVDVSRKRTAA